MKTKTPFSPKQSTGKNFAVVTYGKHAANPLAVRVFSTVADWPKKRGEIRQRLRGIEDARVYAVLRILIPALCRRDPGRFRLFADAIEAVNGSAYPASQVHYQALYEAATIAGDSKVLLIAQSEFKRRVEERRGQQIDPGQFHRVCKQLGFQFPKDPKRGGRPKTKG
jgi:hypothetical protein